MSTSSKLSPFILELFTFAKSSLLGSLDFGSITDWQVLKGAYLPNSCLKYPQRKFKMNFVETFRCCCSLDIVLLTLFSMTWLFVK